VAWKSRCHRLRQKGLGGDKYGGSDKFPTFHSCGNWVQ
jgi:hypothetical protein